MAASFGELYERVAVRTQRWAFYTWYWGDAICVDGLLAGKGDRADHRRTRVVEQVERWESAAPDNFDDSFAPGLAILTLVDQDMLDEAVAKRFVSAVDRLPVLECGFPALEPHRPAFRFGVCIDALYHLPPALAAYGNRCGDTSRTQSAVDMAIKATRVLECPTGWSQWYDDARDKNNAISWSRGVGWALLGLLDLLVVNNGYRSAELEAIVTEMLDRLAKTQDEDGNWAAVLGDRQAPNETSTAAFFVASALHQSVRHIWTPDPPVMDRAVSALVSSIDEDGVATGVSADILPSWEIDGYRAFSCEPSPWGQGAALRALAALTAAESSP